MEERKGRQIRERRTVGSQGVPGSVYFRPGGVAEGVEFHEGAIEVLEAVVKTDLFVC